MGAKRNEELWRNSERPPSEGASEKRACVSDGTLARASGRNSRQPESAHPGYREATVDEKAFAGNEARLVGRQPYRHIADIGRLPDPAPWRVASDCLRRQIGRASSRARVCPYV